MTVEQEWIRPEGREELVPGDVGPRRAVPARIERPEYGAKVEAASEEHTSELQSRGHRVRRAPPGHLGHAAVVRSRGALREAADVGPPVRGGGGQLGRRAGAGDAGGERGDVGSARAGPGDAAGVGGARAAEQAEFAGLDVR